MQMQTQLVACRNLETYHSVPLFQIRLLLSWLIVSATIPCSRLSAVPDIEGDALLDVKHALNDTNHRIANWDSSMVTPCVTWSGVTCSDGHVTSLSLASSGFSGSISPTITKLKYLKSLDLQGNQLSGLLPDYLGNLTYLQSLNLAGNNFSGPIPSTWDKLTSLQHLIISNNKLSGDIPSSLANIQSLIEMDLSYNSFTGNIPSSFFSITKYNFTGNHLKCDSGSQHHCASSLAIPYITKNTKFNAAVGGAAGAALFVFSIGAIAVFAIRRRQSVKGEEYFDVSGEECKISFGQIRRFSWRELQVATDNFSEHNVIGQGGFGKVYRGFLQDSTKVAVKRLSEYHSPGGEAAFLREVELISVAVHKNILRLIGFCITTSERILVYPFMENLSVAYRLRDLKAGEKGLDWPSRNRVALGAARGMEYLHEHCNPKIIHRDLKAANILLDENFEAVVGDFGLAKLVDAKVTHITTQVRGTMGHIAPEYLSTGRSSEKTDVFGYGITLLELVTGQRAIDFSRLEEEEDVLLLDHIKKLQKEKRLSDIVDNNLKQNYDAKEVEVMIQVALLCTQSFPEDRPTMSEVVRMLQGEGLAERWEEWLQLEAVRHDQGLSQVMARRFDWEDEYSSSNQLAVELSTAR